MNIDNRISIKWGITPDDSKAIMLCNYCARQSTFEERANYRQSDRGYIGTSPIDDITVWYLMQCLGCLHMQLIRHDYRMVPGRFGMEPSDGDSTVLLYPSDNDALSGLPDIIAREYQAALKVRDVSLNACAVLVRRTLEVICKHENAEGKTLMQKIENLIQSNRIPPLLADMAHLGAHVTDDEVTDDDVATLLDFVEAILEYLYVAPQRL